MTLSSTISNPTGSPTSSLTRRSFTLGSLAAAAALGLSACGGSSSANDAALRSDGSVDLAKVTLVVGDQKGTSAQQMISAAGLDDTAYTIDWKEFTSGPPMLEALRSGAIDVGQVGNTPPIFAAAGQGGFKIVQAVTYTGEGDVILAPKGSTLTSVADLKGKKVAVAQGSSANYNLLAQLDKAGMEYADIDVQDLQPADALAAFTAGHLDAWAIWEPYTSQAVVTYGASILATGKDVVNGLGFNVAADSSLDDKATKAALADYLARITRAQVWASQNPDDWSSIWAQQTGFEASVTAQAVTRRPLEVVAVNQAVIDSEQEMADAFTDNGLIPSTVDLSGFFDGQFSGAIQKAAGTTWNPDWASA